MLVFEMTQTPVVNLGHVFLNLGLGDALLEHDDDLCDKI